MIHAPSEHPCASAVSLQGMKLQNALLKPAQGHCHLPVLETIHLEEKHLNMSIIFMMTHAGCILVEYSVMTELHIINILGVYLCHQKEWLPEKLC